MKHKINQNTPPDFTTLIAQEITQQINLTLEKALDTFQKEMRQELKYIIQHARQSNFSFLQQELIGVNSLHKKGLTFEQIIKKVAMSWLQ